MIDTQNKFHRYEKHVYNSSFRGNLSHESSVATLSTFNESVENLKYLRILRGLSIKNPSDTLLGQEIIHIVNIFGNFLLTGVHKEADTKINFHQKYEDLAIASQNVHSLSVMHGLSEVLKILKSETESHQSKINLSLGKMRPFYHPEESPDLFYEFQNGYSVIATAMSSGALICSPILSYFNKIGLRVGFDAFIDHVDWQKITKDSGFVISNVPNGSMVKNVLCVDDAVSFSSTEPGTTLKCMYHKLKEKYPNANFLGSQIPTT